MDIVFPEDVTAAVEIDGIGVEPALVRVGNIAWILLDRVGDVIPFDQMVLTSNCYAGLAISIKNVVPHDAIMSYGWVARGAVKDQSAHGIESKVVILNIAP